MTRAEMIPVDVAPVSLPARNDESGIFRGESEKVLESGIMSPPISIVLRCEGDLCGRIGPRRRVRWGVAATFRGWRALVTSRGAAPVRPRNRRNPFCAPSDLVEGCLGTEGLPTGILRDNFLEYDSVLSARGQQGVRHQFPRASLPFPRSCAETPSRA